MDSKRTVLLTIALVLVLVASVFAVAACGTATTTTTVATTATTAAPAATETTAAPAATDTTMAAATDTTMAASTDTTAASGAAAASGTLVVKGLVDNPATWTVADLQKMNPITTKATHPKKGEMDVTGVKLADLFKTLGVQAAAKTLVTTSPDGYMSEVTLSEIPADAMLAIGADGKLNMIMPGMTGKAWATDVVGWEFK